MAKPKVIDHMGEIAATREKIAKAEEQAELTRNALPGAEAEIAQATQGIEKKAVQGLDQASRWGSQLGQFGTPSLFGEMFFLSLPSAAGKDDAARSTTGQVNMTIAENVFVALHKKEMLKIATDAIRVRYANFDGLILDPIAKRTAIKEAEAAVFKLEQDEEALIEAAEDAGMVIQRRADASAEAILGLERGAGVPHNWRSAKYDRLLDERDAQRARMDAARAQLSTAQDALVRLKQNNADPYHANPADADLQAAEEAVAYRRQVLDGRMQQAQAIIAVAANLENYIRDHRQAKPRVPVKQATGQPPIPKNMPVGMRFPGRNGGLK